MRVLLLNGPPRSGKDTIGGILAREIPGGRLCKLAYPIVAFLEREFDIKMAEVEKDEPHPLLLGRTPRDVAIRYSEGFCKPLWGQSFFGKAAVLALKKADPDEVPIFTDSGFLAEVMEILDAGFRCCQIVLHRPGTNFQNDSRGIWEHPQIPQFQFFNDCIGVDNLIKKVRRDLLPRVLEWLEWS